MVQCTYAADGSFSRGIPRPNPRISSDATRRVRLGATSPKSKSTHPYEFVDADTLALHVAHGERNVFKRQPAEGGQQTPQLNPPEAQLG